MGVTYTSRASLTKQAVGDRGWDIPLNRNSDRIDAANAVGALCVTAAEEPSASLNVRVAAGVYRRTDGSYNSYPGTISQAVPAGSTTLLWLDDAATLSTGSAWPSTPHVRLASVVSGGASITSIADARVPFAINYVQGTGGAATAGATYTSAEQAMLQAVYDAVRAMGGLS